MRRNSRRALALVATWAVFALHPGIHAEPGEFSERWETLKGCRLVASEWNDGDSFHVRHDGKEYIFRLYFVDTAEVHDATEGATRTTEQAAYWNVNQATLHSLALKATKFSADLLKAAPFTVRTRWEDAKGRSQLPRNFAVIDTSGGDLAELLVANGLARIFGHYLAHPSGPSAERYRAKLKLLEDQARRAGRGAWGSSPTTARPAPEGIPSTAEPTTEATESDIPAF